MSHRHCMVRDRTLRVYTYLDTVRTWNRLILRRPITLECFVVSRTGLSDWTERECPMSYWPELDSGIFGRAGYEQYPRDAGKMLDLHAMNIADTYERWLTIDPNSERARKSDLEDSSAYSIAEHRHLLALVARVQPMPKKTAARLHQEWCSTAPDPQQITNQETPNE